MARMAVLVFPSLLCSDPTAILITDAVIDLKERVLVIFTIIRA
jgi:hypothetical protein